MSISLNQLNLYRRKHTLHQTSPAAAPTIQPHGKGSTGYDSVPTVEENLESGNRVKVRPMDGTQRVVGDDSALALHMEDQTHQAPSSPHVHSPPQAAPVAAPGVINPLSGLRHSLSSESSLTGYEAVADIKNIKLPLAKPISLANMHVVAFAGMRGAVSFSLAYIFPNSNGNRYVMQNPCHILKQPFPQPYLLLRCCVLQGFGAVYGHCDRIVYEFFQWYTDGAADSLAQHHHQHRYD